MLDRIKQIDTELLIFLNNLGNKSWDPLWVSITDKFTFLPLFILIIFFLFKKNGTKGLLVILLFISVLILFTDQFVDAFMGRAYNCHPSLLPAFKGLNAIHNNFASNTLFMGCSIHQIESKIDGGNCILQAALPMNREDSFQKKRNCIFEAQLVTTIQFMRWCLNERITIQDGQAFITNALFESSNFSPNLDVDIHNFINNST